MIDRPNTGDPGREIVARLERLPYSSWHTKMRAIIATAWFFDAFDALAIAYVLPALIGLWKITPPQIGFLIAVGYAGQIIGAIAAGWIAERVGRIPVIIGTLLIFTGMSIACAFAWNYDSLMWFRFVQGIGLGGEVPIMAAYVNEFAKAERRGRFSIGLQFFFAIGLAVVGLVGVWAVPNLGWQSMFIIGAVPALLSIPMRAVLPESPRWLASKGRFDEADRVLRRIEDIAVREGKPLPPLPAHVPAAQVAPTRLRDIFKGVYLRRTLAIWVLWISAYFVIYGLTAWTPSLFRTAYNLPVAQANTYGFIMALIGLVGTGLCIVLIDRVGRKPLFTTCLILSSLPLLFFLTRPDLTAPQVLAVIGLSWLFMSVVAIGLATYTAENYPNNIRAIGGGIAGGWQRAASMVGPLLVGILLPQGGLPAVFVMFGVVALVGGLITLVLANETRGQVLEELSKPPTADDAASRTAA